jgi:phosphatidylglycerol---prolipoprotein diacylglyceryl transferase
LIKEFKLIDGFYIGSMKIYFYGIIIMIGVLFAVWISIRETKARGLTAEIIWDLVPWLLVSGIVGARIWHVLTPSKSMGVGIDYYFSHPIEILNIRQGGLGIPGGVIGGVFALIVFAKKKNLKFFEWADIIAPGLAIAQAIGRWGNFINQELYGPPSNLPWAIYIDPAHRISGYEEFSRFHPMFLYESIWNLINYMILSFLSKRYEDKIIPGDIFFAYLIIYPIGRFLLEFIRLDASYLVGVNANQITMAVVAITSTCILVIRHGKKRSNQKNN